MDDLGRHYNPPPTPPRDRMWARIEAARRRRPWRRVWALAAVLALGIILGRLGYRDAPVVTPPVAPTEFSRHAAARLFSGADVLLTDLQSHDHERRAGVMLAQTRLLLDTELADDPDTRQLLLDLELVLARIAADDVDGIRRDLMVNRLRLGA